MKTISAGCYETKCELLSQRNEHSARAVLASSALHMPSAAALTDAAADAAGGGDLDSALALVRRALSLEPQSVPALVCLGNVLAERGDAGGPEIHRDGRREPDRRIEQEVLDFQNGDPVRLQLYSAHLQRAARSSWLQS